MKKVLIVGGGPANQEQLKQELAQNPDMIIVADGGAKLFKNMGVFPQVVIGDLDSLDEDSINWLTTREVKILRFPVDKDETDLELAIDYAIHNGAVSLRILGGLGGRFDHSLGNIGLLLRAKKKGAEACLIDENHQITVSLGETMLQPRKGWAVSLLPLSNEVTGVTTTGLAYPLINETLYFTGSRGLHNRFLNDFAAVKFDQGILLIVYFKEA